MIIVNATLKGEHTYEITVGEAEVYRVSAFDVDTAVNLVADYIEQHTFENYGYFGKSLFRQMAYLEHFNDVREYAKRKGFTECGTNNIYINITSIKGCPNG
jgi:hypothetical protein